MHVKSTRAFRNGVVYALETADGYPLETTDTFLPFYTRDAIGRRQNALTSADFGDRTERWMIGVSVMSGCPVGCKFCATGSLARWRPLTSVEIVEQVRLVLGTRPDDDPMAAREFKINYTRMGEPFLNIKAVRQAIDSIEAIRPGTHHYVSTIGIRASEFAWIRGNVTLQVSVHSLDETRRDDLIPWRTKMTLAELGAIRTRSALKTTVNLTLVDEADFDIAALKRYFDPKHFFIKLSPINPNAVSDAHAFGTGVVEGVNLA